MLKYFICPDGQQIAITDCLKESGCRMGSRCATRSFLRMASADRPWTGRPSTTQLLTGTMEAFLRLTKDYATSPDGRAFMIVGTRGHSALEMSSDECSLLEQKFDGADVTETGISDVIEIEGNKVVLADNKVSGSYKIAKALGWHVIDKPTGEVFKSGPRKGMEKMTKELIRDDQSIDRWSWVMQLNKYRIEAEKNGVHIDELKIQCIARDGGTFIARSRGVFRNVYYFNIEILPDAEVLAYFKEKREALELALKQGAWAKACDAKENWDGLKCQRYCDVAEFCFFGRYLKAERESEDAMIKGLSSVRRLPRLGKIRLGIKKTKMGPDNKPVLRDGEPITYPSEIDWFRLDPSTPIPEERDKLLSAYHKLYGDQPKRLKVMFPVGDVNKVFAQFYKRYGGRVLRCRGDGETAECISREFATGLKEIGPGEIGGIKVECRGRECPFYQQNKCGESASLQFLLPEIEGAGIWEIVTGSYHSIVNINSCFDYIRALCGRFHMIPLLLERREQAITYEGKTSNHYILHINMDIKVSELQKMALIDATKILLELPAPQVEQEDIVDATATVIVPDETPLPPKTPEAPKTPANPAPQRQPEGPVDELRAELRKFILDACKGDTSKAVMKLKAICGKTNVDQIADADLKAAFDKAKTVLGKSK